MLSNELDPRTLAGGEGIAPRRALEALEARGPRGAALEDLGAQLGLASAEVEEALHGLERSGLAAEWARRWYAVRHTAWVAATLELLADGGALARVVGRREPDLAVEQRHTKDARDGDLVLLKRLKGRLAVGAGPALPRAAVVKVLAERRRRVVGTLEERDRRRWLVPYDAKAAIDLEVAGGEDLPLGEWVAIALPSTKGKRGQAPAQVVERLGTLAQPGTDTRVVLRHYEIPEEFPHEVIHAAAAMPADPIATDWSGRLDLRDEIVVTIDGATARDFDDALSIAPRSGGGWRLGVHIADVGHYVEEGGALDREAYRRGTSVYYPERAVPMLPEGLSNGLCSLRPGVPRLTLSAHLEIDATGAVIGRAFAESVIRSARRLTYDEVRRVLEEPRAEDERSYGAVADRLRELRSLMEVLLRRRTERGSIDFDLPEGDVMLDTDGNTVGVKPSERTVAHRIVEECMIAANEAVAFALDAAQCPALHRVHDPPSPVRLEELREVLRSLGHDLPGELTEMPPATLQDAVRQVAGRPEEAFVSALVLRTVQRALYSPESRGHYALAAPHYTHFTSPIRRYPDLVVHRRLRALLRGTASEEAARSLLVERLPVIGEHCSETERRAEQSERDLLQWKKVRFLADRVGESFAGRITGVQPFGLFVQLDGWFVDGLVPIRTLADDFYLHEPESHRLVGQESGRVFQLAQAVTVDLTGIDERRRGLQLRVSGMPEPRRPTREAAEKPVARGRSARTPRYDRRR
jgi:ribonuclease R